MSNITISIGGEKHSGWTSLRVMRSLETGADQFELTLTQLRADAQRPRPIAAGAACELRLNSELLLTGYVDEMLPEYDAGQRTITAVGRSKVGDLVDCSLLGMNGKGLQWKGATLHAIAKDLAGRFGIDVRAETDVGGPFRTVALEPGQTVWEFLEYLARLRAVRLVSAPDGALVITRAGNERIGTALILGENIRKASGTFSTRERFSDYVVLAQQTGNDNVFADAAAAPIGKAQDIQISRYRPTVVIADGPADIADCQRRAAWQRNTAAGRGQGIVYTVDGWEHGSGIWSPNRQVRVRDSWQGIDTELLIVSVQLLLDDTGQRSELRLMPKAAFDLVELAEPQEASLWQAQ